MYSGKDIKVTLLCDNYLVGVIFDHFGEHQEKYRNPELEILIFAQSKNKLGQTTYKFLGVYGFDKSENKNKRIIYKRTCEKYELSNLR